MATEYDWDLTSDISALGTVSKQDIATMVRTLVPDEKHGGIVFGVNEPDVENNPRYARYMYLASDASIPTKQPTIKTYDPVLKKWVSGTIPSRSITNDQLAGGIELSKLKNILENAAGYLIIVDTDGENIVPVAFTSSLLPTIPLSKLTLDGGGPYQIIRRNIDNNAWELADASYDMLEGSLPASAIDDDTITKAMMSDDSVGTDELEDASVTGVKLADNSVKFTHFSHDSDGPPFFVHKRAAPVAGALTSVQITTPATITVEPTTWQMALFSYAFTKHYTGNFVRINGVVNIAANNHGTIIVGVFFNSTLINMVPVYYNTLYQGGDVGIPIPIPFYGRATLAGVGPYTVEVKATNTTNNLYMVADRILAKAPNTTASVLLNNTNVNSWMNVTEYNSNDS